MTEKAPTLTRGQKVLRIVRHSWPVVVFDVVAPVAIYLILTDLGVAEVPALLCTSIPPLIATIVTAVRERRLSGVGIIVLASVALAIVFALLGGSARDIVARDAYGNAVLGLAFAITMFVGKRPLLYYLVRLPGEDFVPGLGDSFDTQWEENRHFRKFIRVASAVAAIVLLVESVVRFIFAYTLPIAVTLAIFGIEGNVVWAVLLVLFVRGFVRARSLGKAEMEAARTADPAVS